MFVSVSDTEIIIIICNVRNNNLSVADRQTDRQAGRQTNRQTDRQADRQTDI